MLLRSQVSPDLKERHHVEFRALGELGQLLLTWLRGLSHISTRQEPALRAGHGDDGGDRDVKNYTEPGRF